MARPRRGPRPAFGRAPAALVPLGLSAFAALALLAGPTERTLAAKAAVPYDSDADGLPDRQEIVIGTDPHLPDTDFDGYTDGQELALQSSPTDFGSVPEATQLSIGMTARGEANKLKVLLAIFDPDGDLSNNSLRMGALLRGNICMVPSPRLLGDAGFIETPGLGGVLYTLDMEIPQGPLLAIGTATYFGAVGSAGQPGYASAAKVDFVVRQGVVMMREILREPGDPPFGPTPNGPTPGISANLAIPPDGDGVIPVDWNAGEVCMQETQITGVSGVTVTHDVTAAECVEGWDSYCASDCHSTIGSQFETVDTGALLGG